LCLSNSAKENKRNQSQKKSVRGEWKKTIWSFGEVTVDEVKVFAKLAASRDNRNFERREGFSIQV